MSLLNSVAKTEKWNRMICETLICTFDQNVQSAGRRQETVVMGRRARVINQAIEEGMQLQTNAILGNKSLEKSKYLIIKVEHEDKLS